MRDVVCFLIAALVWSGMIAWDFHCGILGRSEKPRTEKPCIQKAAEPVGA